MPGKLTAFIKSMAIGQKSKEQILHIKALCKHREIEVAESDLMEKKLFFILMPGVVKV